MAGTGLARSLAAKSARAGRAKLRSAATRSSWRKAADRKASLTAMYRSIPSSMAVSPGHEKPAGDPPRA
jgi:hypothetical protein